MKELVKKLTEAFGPSGREDGIRKLILEEIDNYVDGYKVDKVGNILAWKGQGEKKILLDAHMDEIGVVVTNIDKNGFLRIEPIGGVSPYTIFEKRIRFEKTTGIVGMEGETIDDIKKNLSKLSFDKLYVDIGVKNKEEAEKLVPIGSFGVYDSYFTEVGGRYVSKSMDDRIGCAVIIEVLKKVKNPKITLFASFSVQEEVGLVGASVVAYDVMPDEAIAVDVTDSADTPKAIKRHPMVLGKGPAIKVVDKASISDRNILERLVNTSEKKGIPYQMEVLIFGGTNAAVLQRTRYGIPSATVSIPTRYIHTPSEMVEPSDVEKTIDLLVSYLEGK